MKRGIELMSWGLALGSGGLRGVAHIGIMKVLERHGLKPDFIAGTSAGAVVAAFYAAGIPAEKIESYISLVMKGFPGKRINETEMLMSHIRKKGILPLGLLEGKNTEKMLKTFLGNKSFSDLTVPAAIIATDLDTAETVACSKEEYRNTNSGAVFVTGAKLHEAVRASISIPGLFAPKTIGSRRLITGTVTNSIPIDVLKDMGADKVVAVDLEIGKTKEADNLIKILLQTMDVMTSRFAGPSLSKANLVLKPETFNARLLDFQKLPDLIAAGEECANANLNKIKKMILSN